MCEGGPEPGAQLTMADGPGAQNGVAGGSDARGRRRCGCGVAVSGEGGPGGRQAQRTGLRWGGVVGEGGQAVEGGGGQDISGRRAD